MREPLPVLPRPAWLALLLVAGCASSSDFELQITPTVLPGQDPFATSPELKLFLDHTDGTSEILYLGPAEGGEAELTGVPPLDAGTVVGLILEEPGGDPSAHDPSRLLAYGQATLGEDLARGGTRAELGVLVPQFATVGAMATLAQPQIAHAVAVGMAPGGSVFLFGGDRQPNAPAGTLDRILALRDTDARPWSFEPLEATLPEPLSGMSAITVEVEGEPRILLTGGRPEWGTSGPNLTTTLLFDPVAGEIVWGTGKKQPKLPVGRSGHDSLTLADGSVFVYGGFTGGSGTEAPGSWAIFDPDALDWTYSGTSDAGVLGAAAASLGSAGVLMCGGAVADGPTHFVAIDDCSLVTLQGAVLPAPRLPEPAAYLAMASLPDGSVLASGGIGGSLEAREGSFATAPAHAKAWLFDGTKWWTVGSMTYARAEHALIPTSTGRIVAVGGVGSTGHLYPISGPAVRCTEVFDPVARAFSAVGGSCVDAGAGAKPPWAALPGEDAFVLEGLTLENPTSSYEAYGVLGLGPDPRRLPR